ncbi:MAG: hypothetical protein A2086_16400 [Spirochaetes bacterium GWD1_27_9]|nr:MAG: hypothetical protein A2Y34_16615 [Spirochaetes bacterium GWC1_27_15]OHD33013.1 MAG: hypothetical protein A2086_16400 [Spirochaetes bacterium GWD1_27_9]
MRKLYLIFILFIFLFSCKSYIEKISEETANSSEIRVKLKLGNQIEIPLLSHIVVEDDLTKRRFFFTKKTIKIAVKDDFTKLNDKNITNPIKIYSLQKKTIIINDRSYLGVIKIFPLKDGFEVINYIPIETYLLSVLPSEVPIKFPIEALKAQVVIARTYSLYFINKYRDKRNFDVDNTVSYQVYNGFNLDLKNDDLSKIKKAVKETFGEIITYENKPIIAYFHSNSGGKTRSGKEYFGQSSNFAYLTSKEDPFSIGKPNDKWNCEVLIKDIKKSLDLTNDILESFFTYNEDGFVDKLNYSNKTLSSKEIRKKIGYFVVKSERFKIKIEKNKIKFEGIGFGHGVGLSQWGAESMAEQGYKYKEIIQFYYPSTNISKLLLN